MGISEINRPLDNHAKQPEKITTARDLTRLLCSQEQKPEKLQLLPEREFLLGGMPKWRWMKARHDGEASTSRDTQAQDADQRSASEQVERRGHQASAGRSMRAENLARMSPDEQVSWCMRGGLAEALGPSGDRAFIPVIKDILRNRQIGYSMLKELLHAIGQSRCAAEFKTEIMQIVRHGKENSGLRMFGLYAIELSRFTAEFKTEIMQIVRDREENPYVRAQGLSVIQSSRCILEFKTEIMQIVRDRRENPYMRNQVLFQMGLSRCAAEFKTEIMQIVMNREEDNKVREHGLFAIGRSECAAEFKAEIMQIRSDPDIDNGVRKEIDDILIILNNTPTPFSSEASSSQRAGEPRSPERPQRNATTASSSEASSSHSTRESRSPERRLMPDQMKNVPDEYPQMEGRENDLKHDMRIIQQKHQEQITKMQQERDHFQRQLRDALQERDQARGQLRDTLQERDQARGQLRDALQEHNRTQEQTQRDLRSAQEQLSQMRIQEEQRKQTWDRLYETLMNMPGQLGRQYERGQSSRGELRANDALPTTVEGMQEQLEGERGRQQELFERVLRLQDGIQRTLREHGEDVPNNERLNEVLRQGIWNLVGYHRLDETLFPRQEFGGLPSLRQRVHNFYLQTVSEYTTSLNLSSGQIAGEFVDQLQDQLGAHNRPNQELIDTSEDVQELVTGRRPNRTPQQR